MLSVNVHEHGSLIPIALEVYVADDPIVSCRYHHGSQLSFALAAHRNFFF